jgi:nickel superoxide dismutase
MKFIPSSIFRLLPSEPVYAHCDIPCGIYDPKPAQIAAATVLKMVQKINELSMNNELLTMNSLTRFVLTKEEHAQKCKAELLILWTDYFKEEHLEKFPDLHHSFWQAAKLCSKAKQTVDLSVAQELVKAVDNIAEIFTESKK